MSSINIDVDTAVTLPVNAVGLVDDTDYKTPEEAIAYNASGMDLEWHFITSAGVYSVTSVTPTTGGGDYDWSHTGNAKYKIGVPASGGASINNDAEGYGWFEGQVTGVLPFRSPTFRFRAASVNDALCDGGDLLDVNATEISGDTGAADNLEAAYDGTGYDVGGIDVSELNQIVDDLLNGGRLDLLVDAIKAKTDNLAFTTAGKVDARVDYVGTNAVTSPDDFKATSVTVSDKTGFSLAADQSGVTIGTVNAMAGTIATLDALDAAQDSQHSTTQAAIGALNNIAATDIVSAGPITTLSGAVVNVDTVDTCTTNTDMRGTDNALLAASTPANFAALGINVSGHVSRVTLVDTTTTNTDMRGTDGANTTTPPSVSAIRTEIDSNSTQLAAILQDTGTTLPAQITLAQNDLDILTGTDGATLSTASTTAIGTGFLSTALTKGTAGTIERAFWQILKTQAVTDGTAVADASNTTTTFYTDLTAANGVYDHMIILFTSNGLEGEARPIDTYVQTNGVITLQEALTTAPTGNEEFIILPQHAHPISEIQNGLATSTALQTAQDDLDILTGTDGVTLATVQGNYAPAKAGDQMDLVDAPNATAVTAFQNGLALATKLLNYVRLLARKDSAVATDLATELGDINADTGTGTGAYSNNDALESIRDNASGLDAAGVRAAVGLAAANLDTQLGAIAGDTGSGANSITPTVTDGTDPLESAKVRFTKGAESYLQSTNASGTFSTPFALDNGTWTVAITLPGYTFSTTTLVVTGNATPTYAMTATGLSVPDSPRIRARLLVLDKTTKEGKSGVELQVTVTDAAFADGYASEATTITVTSDANGLAEWYALPGESYKITGENVSSTVTVPKTATDPHSVKSVLV